MLVPARAAILTNEVGDVEEIQVAVALVLRHSEHEGPRIKNTGHKFARAPIERKRVPNGEEVAEEHLESVHHRGNLGHDEDEALA